jgi:hypothetical protein
MRIATLAFLAVLAVPAVAQPAPDTASVPDTTAPWRYYPLHVGDEWQYDVEAYYYDYCRPCRYQEVRRVVGTAVVEGWEYAVVRTQTHNVPTMPNPPGPGGTFYVRFDPAAATPVYYGGGQEHPVDGGGCRLDEAFPAPPDTSRAITCPDHPDDPWLPATVRGGYDLPLPFGGDATQKAFRYPYGFAQQQAVYAAGIGLLAGGGYYEIDLGEFMTLRYARVDGVTYGSPVVAGDTGSEPRRPLSLAATPNPTAGPLTLALDFPAAGPVVVEVFDALGRRVYRREATLPAGAHALDLDASAWAPGAYVVRVTASGAAAAVRVVRR